MDRFTEPLEPRPKRVPDDSNESELERRERRIQADIDRLRYFFFRKPWFEEMSFFDLHLSCPATWLLDAGLIEWESRPKQGGGYKAGPKLFQ